MSVTKAEMEEINRRLQEAIRRLEAENRELLGDNRHLSMRLSQCNGQLKILSARYLRLANYVKRLRVWLTANAR